MVIVCHLEECPRYRDRARPMVVADETETHWLFRCPTCENWRAIPKTRIGGTLGAGRPDGAPRTQWAVAWAGARKEAAR